MNAYYIYTSKEIYKLKRMLIFSIFFLLSFVLAACGNEVNPFGAFYTLQEAFELKSDYPDATKNHVSVFRYYRNHDGYLATMMSDDYTDFTR